MNKQKKKVKFHPLVALGEVMRERWADVFADGVLTGDATEKLWQKNVQLGRHEITEENMPSHSTFTFV